MANEIVLRAMAELEKGNTKNYEGLMAVHRASRKKRDLQPVIFEKPNSLLVKKVDKPNKDEKVMPEKKVEKWPQATLNFLKDNYGKLSDEQIAETLDKTTAEVKYKREKLGLCVTMRIWSKADEDYIRKNYSTKSVKDISEKLDRTIKAVKSRAAILGVTKTNTYDFVGNNGHIIASGTLREIGEALGVDVHDVNNWRYNGTPRGYFYIHGEDGTRSRVKSKQQLKDEIIISNREGSTKVEMPSFGDVLIIVEGGHVIRYEVKESVDLARKI